MHIQQLKDELIDLFADTLGVYIDEVGKEIPAIWVQGEPETDHLEVRGLEISVLQENCTQEVIVLFDQRDAKEKSNPFSVLLKCKEAYEIRDPFYFWEGDKLQIECTIRLTDGLLKRKESFRAV